MQHCIFLKHNHGKYFSLSSQTPTWPETISVMISSLRKLTSWRSDCCSHEAHKWTDSGKVPLLSFFFKLDLRLVFHMVDRNIFLDRMEEWIGFPDAELHWICESFLFNRIYILPKKEQRSNAKYITAKKKKKKGFEMLFWEIIQLNYGLLYTWIPWS